MVERLAKPKTRTAAPSDLVSVKVRMKESQRRIYQAEAERAGISINAAIERRLNRTLSDDAMEKVIKQAAEEAAKFYSKLVRAMVGKFLAELEGRMDGRFLDLHALIIDSRKEN
jgi:hypothetical protein